MDEKGNHILVNQDFENPAIVHFKVECKSDDTFKVNWKEVENEVKAKNPALKIVYSRADPHDGHLAVSQHKLKAGIIDKLVSSTIKVQDKKISFTKL